MLVSLNWLQEFIAKPLKLELAIKAMEAAGIEVESVHLTPTYDPKIVVAKVVKVRAHPNADKLRLATVEAGATAVEIVCGTPNLEVGQRVPLAKVGAKLPNGTEITEAEIRGLKSPGMLCSPQELGLASDHSGLMVLGDETKVGQKLSEIIPSQPIIDVKTAANRPDLNGLTAIAREVSAQLGIRTKVENRIPELAAVSSQFNNQVKTLVPRYCLAKLSLPAKLPASPDFIIQRLRLSGLRPINAVVDITNYVMLETAQPLHAFDAAKIKGRIIIRTARTKERLITLDGKERQLAAQDLVIADQAKTIGLAGVIGGQASEVSHQTTAILLEAANFDGVSVRRTAQRHNLRTDASARFERGLPVQLAVVGMERAIELLKRYAKAKLEWVADELNVWPWIQHIGVRPEQLSRLAGFPIKANEITKSLQRLGFEASEFNLIDEAKKHLGKPYKWGAKFRTDGDQVFDCGYFLDYLFSLIGKMIGHTAPQIMDSGRPIKLSELKPGDMLFRDGFWKEVKAHERKNVSHVAMYIGDNQIIHAENYRRINGQWQEMPKADQKVRIDPLSIITEDPQFHEARRLIDNVDGWVAVTTPWWRPDVRTPEDVFEEVIKSIGLDKVQETLPLWQPTALMADRSMDQSQDLRSLLLGLELDEVITTPFVSREQLSALALDPKHHVAIKNPLNQEATHLTSSFLPQLLAAFSQNTRLSETIGWFELGRIFTTNQEAETLGVIVQHSEPYRRIKNIYDNLSRWSNQALSLRIVKNRPWLHPARQAEVLVANQSAGIIGELNPKLVQDYKLTNRAAYLELGVEKLLAGPLASGFEPVSKYQSQSRDLTFELPRTVTWQAITEGLNDLPLTVSYLGDYLDPEQPRHRALTLRLQFEPQTQEDATDLKLEQLTIQVVKRLGRQFQGDLKS